MIHISQNIGVNATALYYHVFTTCACSLLAWPPVDIVARRGGWWWGRLTWTTGKVVPVDTAAIGGEQRSLPYRIVYAQEPSGNRFLRLVSTHEIDVSRQKFFYWMRCVIRSFSSAGWAIRISWFKCCLSVCLDVNQGGTKRSRCARRLVILRGVHRLTNEPWPHTKN